MPKQKKKSIDPLLNLPEGLRFFISFANHFSADMLGAPDFMSKARVKNEIEAWKKLRSLLDKIIKEKKLRNWEEMDYFLGLSGAWRYVLDKGRITKAQHLFVGPQDNPDLVLYSNQARLVAFDLLEFLQDKANIARLRKCPECGEFFVASRARKEYVFCSTTCQKKYDNAKPERKKSRKENKKRGRPIKYAAKSEKSTILPL
jgi:hypothetical protein